MIVFAITIVNICMLVDKHADVGTVSGWMQRWMQQQFAAPSASARNENVCASPVYDDVGLRLRAAASPAATRSGRRSGACPTLACNDRGRRRARMWSAAWLVA